jgi:hypothetical protein
MPILEQPKNQVLVNTKMFDPSCDHVNFLRLQGISWQSEQSNLALLRIQILIFTDILGPMCS